MNTQVSELVKAIRRLPDEDRIKVLRQLSLEPSKLVPLDELQVRYAGRWVAVALPEDEDPHNPRQGRLLAYGPDDEVVWAQVNNLPYDGLLYVFYCGPATGLDVPVVFPDKTLPVQQPHAGGVVPVF